MYQHLQDVLIHTKALGLSTTITTNGLLLSKTRLESLKGLTDLIAISIDGEPDSHNQNRGETKAFEKMNARLGDLRESGIPFGFIFTLSQYNLHELEWVTQFALNQGARLLQIHPLEEAGRATEKRLGEKPDGLEMSFAYLEVARIQKVVGDKMFVQLDITNQDALHQKLKQICYVPIEDMNDCLLAEVVSPLVIEADGTVVPLMYGFSRDYAFGNLHNDSLRKLSLDWRSQTFPAFQELYRRTLEFLSVSTKTPFLNWYELIRRVSYESS